MAEKQIQGTIPRLLAPSLTARTVRVAVVIPVRNERREIEETVEAALHQTFDSSRTEIIVVDGESDDGTREILDGLRTRTGRIRVLTNPKRTIPTALNLGIGATTADIIVRVDGRCHISPDYVQRCVDLLVESRAGNVGGLVRAVGKGYVGKAIALAMGSRFGVGNSRYHYLERREWVDTVYMGAFSRRVLQEVGLFDEELVRNQDDELNYRIRAAGYGVLLDPGLSTLYTPPRSYRHLWGRQFYQYGRWKIRVIEKHPGSIQLRHLAPGAMVLTLSTSLASLPVTRRIWFAAPVGLYAAVLAGSATWTARRDAKLAPGVAAAFACMHLGYGTGFLMGIVGAVRSRTRLKSAGRSNNPDRSGANTELRTQSSSNSRQSATPVD